MKPFRFFQSVFLTCALLFGVVSAGYGQTTQQPTSSSPRIQKVIDQVQKIGKDQDVTVTLTSDLEYYGMITRIDVDRFEIDEIDLRKTVTVYFKDVQNVKKGYGKVDPSTGKRTTRLARDRSWILMLAVAGAALGFTFWGISKVKEKKPRIPPGFPPF